MMHSDYKINTLVYICKGIKVPKGTETHRSPQGDRWELVGGLPSYVYKGLMKWADYEYWFDYRHAIIHITGTNKGLSEEEKTENKERMFEHIRRLLELNNVQYSEDIDKSFDEIKALYL